MQAAQNRPPVWRLVQAAVLLGLIAVAAIPARLGQGCSGHTPARALLAFEGPAKHLHANLSSHQFFLNPADLRKGQAYRGSGAHLSNFAAKLVAGQPVHVVVAGGSVAWGQGAILGGSFGKRFFNWLNATWPSPLHRYTNAAKPGVTSALFARCATDMIPQDPDLVVLEFNFNDYYPNIQLESPGRAVYEQLVRRVLSSPTSPAVISLHFFSYWHAKPALNSPGPALFYRTGEDDLAVIAQYYDLPVLSLRNAVYSHMLLNEQGFQVDIFNPRKAGLNATALESYFFWDDHHPYDRTGHRAMADLLVATVEEAVQERLLGAPMMINPLPPPMFPGNWEPTDTTCKLGHAFKPVLDQERSKGFIWQARNPNASHVESQKWGWTASTPGTYAVLRLNTKMRQHGVNDNSTAPARIFLGHLCSWQDLGTATVTCIKGCNCTRTTMNHHWKHNNTQTDLMPLEVSQHDACEVQVTVDAPANSTTKPLTVLNAVLLDNPVGPRISMGNVGQWDMMG